MVKTRLFQLKKPDDIEITHDEYGWCFIAVKGLSGFGLKADDANVVVDRIREAIEQANGGRRS
jgi:hypothetical protein